MGGFKVGESVTCFQGDGNSGKSKSTYKGVVRYATGGVIDVEFEDGYQTEIPLEWVETKTPHTPVTVTEEQPTGATAIANPTELLEQSGATNLRRLVVESNTHTPIYSVLVVSGLLIAFVLRRFA